MINTVYIYFLHKGNNIPFYVGKTKDIKVRRTNHRNKKNDQNIELEVLDEVEDLNKNKTDE
jgi:predicted GIY-YIG superfamily endonuclease